MPLPDREESKVNRGNIPIANLSEGFTNSVLDDGSIAILDDILGDCTNENVSQTRLLDGPEIKGLNQKIHPGLDPVVKDTVFDA